MLGQKYFYSMSLFDARFILSIISVVFWLQMFVSDHGWSCISVRVKPDPGELISTLLWSLKRALQRKDIKKRFLKFIDYCNFCGVPLVPPFPVTFLVVCLFKVDKSSSSYASSDMAPATLKWFHLFGLSNGADLLDSSICHILLEAARRDKPVSVKRRLYLLRLLRV